MSTGVTTEYMGRAGFVGVPGVGTELLEYEIERRS
jgi:hypothetical protein